MSLRLRFLNLLWPPAVLEPSLASWRAALIAYTLGVIALGAGTTIAIVMISRWPEPVPPAIWVVVLTYVAAFTLSRLAKRSPQLRATIAVATFLFVAPFLFASYGQAPAAYLCLLVGCVLAGLLIGPLAATGFIAVSASLMLLGAWAHLAEWGAGGTRSAHWDGHEVMLWIRAGVVWLSMTSWLVFVTSWLTTRFEHALRDKDLALAAARDEAAGRLRSETQRSATELALIEAQKHEAMSRVAGGVSHEFNNALFVILGWNDLLSHDDMSEAQRRQGHAAIASAGRSAAELAKRLLAMSRERSGPPHETQLLPLIEEGAGHLARLLPDDIRVSTELAEVPAVSIDPGQVQQLLLNLALHARDAMPHGGRLAIALRKVAADETGPAPAGVAWVVLELRDTGPGMEESTRAQLFEPRTDASVAATDAALGLSASHAIVTRAGGHIQVESEPGRGTTIRVMLPVAGSEARVAPAPATDRPRRRARVIVVEDEQAVRELIELALRRHGHTVRSAEDGDQAMRMLDEPHTHFDLLCVDGILPGAPATTIIERFRVLNPGCPILVCSGNIGTLQLKRLVEDERLPFLPKPFSPQELASRVDDLLAGIREPARS